MIVSPCSTQQPSLELENVSYATPNHLADINKKEVVPIYSAVGGSEEQNDYSMVAANTVPNSAYTRWSHVPSVYSAVEHTTDPGVPIQSKYSMAVSIDETDLISSEYSMADNDPEYAVVNKPKNTLLPEEAKKPPPQPVNGGVNASQNQESSLSREIIPVYAQPDMSKKKKRTPLLITSESTDESPPPIPLQAEVL